MARNVLVRGMELPTVEPSQFIKEVLIIIKKIPEEYKRSRSFFTSDRR